LKSDKQTLQAQLSEQNAGIEKLKAELAAAKKASSSSSSSSSSTPVATPTTASTTDAENTTPPSAEVTTSAETATPPAAEEADPVKALLDSSDEEARLKGIAQGDTSAAFEAKLTDLLADSSDKVQEAAARELWSRQKDSHCGKTVESLRDEVRGHSMVDGKSTGMTLTLGPDRALKALDVLVKFAPEEEKKQVCVVWCGAFVCVCGCVCVVVVVVVVVAWLV
jgi:hypothetical protein